MSKSDELYGNHQKYGKDNNVVALQVSPTSQKVVR